MWPLLALGVLGFFFLGGGGTVLQTVIGYIHGQETPFQAAGIGDYGCLLRADAASAWLKMKAQAIAQGGVNLRPKGSRSAFRTHDQQADMVTERPDFAAAIDFSPHQAGIAVDVDLTDIEVLPWLQEYAADFGWYPLPTDAKATKEPWHWEFHGTTTTGIA